MIFGIVRRSLVRNLKHYRNFVASKTMTSNAGVPADSIVKKLEEFAPLELSEKWDNTGVLIEPFINSAISKILLTNDLTEDVMDEAVFEKAQMIISYHPPIFSGLKRITQNNWKERIISKCFTYNIYVYSPHTSWDSVNGGVNDWLASGLPEHGIKCIVESPTDGCGQGRLCILNTPVSLDALVKTIKKHIGLDGVQLALSKTHRMSSEVKTVALCAGSGISVLRGIKADVYLTGEMSHHEVLDAVHNETSVILTNHSNSERGFLRPFSKTLEKMLDNRVTVIVSQKDEDPLKII